MPHATPFRILFIDAYDSFTNNIVSLLETSLKVEVTVIKIDEDIQEFPSYLRPFAAVVAGAGPGDPRNAKDVGLIGELWKLSDDDILPVLGICLGFQSLVLAFGGSIERLPEPRHGMIRRVSSDGRSIFKGVGTLETVQYHSLHAVLGDTGHDGGHYLSSLDAKGVTLRPLAWDLSSDNNRGDWSRVPLLEPEAILMAVEHGSKPFFGIQFHAESVCSHDNARQVILNWWHTAMSWREDRKTCRPIADHRNLQHNPPAEKDIPLKTSNLSGFYENPYRRTRKTPIATRVMNIGTLTINIMCRELGLTEGETIVLDSEKHQRQEVGEFSIIGIITPSSTHFDYNTRCSKVRLHTANETVYVDLANYNGNIFSYLKDYMNGRKAESPHLNVPFWGGLMGFVNYEACLETIAVGSGHSKSFQHVPDLSFVFVERSIVIDHVRRKVYIQSITPNDEDWLDSTRLKLQGRAGPKECRQEQRSPLRDAEIILPDDEDYKRQVRACQTFIRAGDSYELCLTTQATIKTPTPLPAWPLYQRLRTLNPSPFAAYVRLGKLTLLSSSPERFLHWSRASRKCSTRNQDEGYTHDIRTSICQFRPIKGTVKKQPDPDQPPLTLAEATALLGTPKERAENLMIVDLIRHDLHGVAGSGQVSVPKLMVVEEYATLFQLVSVIEGELVIIESDENQTEDHSPITAKIPIKNNASHPPTTSTSTSTSTCTLTGIDVLAASLPPGSMTGAPKLRSTQLLQTLEQRRRGVYSGVLGYMDVGGGGDFSVVIRSAVRWDDDSYSTKDTGGCNMEDRSEDLGRSEEGDTWTIGAGGAITSLSTEEGEWDEMLAKLKSTSRLFECDGEVKQN